MQGHREREHTEARFLSDQLLEEGRWHHVMVVLNKALIRNSTCALFVDGKHVNTQRVREFYSLRGACFILNLNENIKQDASCSKDTQFGDIFFRTCEVATLQLPKWPLDVLECLQD